MSAQVAFTVADNWGTGFVGNVAVLNDASAENGWTVSFDAGFTITSVWNAELVSHAGTTYTFRNLGWNGSLAPNGTASFGFQATPGGTAATVNGIRFNGATAGGGGTPTPLSGLSVGDAIVTEGNAGETLLSFTVSLSAPAAAPVTVGFATANGTALAGSDYLAASGTLSFAAGQTSQTVTVRVLGDTAMEASETLSLVLSGATGATIADGTGTGTIANDDQAAGGGGATGGFLSTRGNQIVDAAGRPFQLNAVNWFGMETTRFAPDGLHARSYKDMMDQMKALGFNAIRLPFSGQAIEGDNAPTSIDYALNPDLQGLRGAAIIDRIAEYANQIGLKILLDHHRGPAGDGPNPNGLWYDATYTEAKWIAMWQSLAQRYAGNAAVIGADLQNEPHGAAWNDWAAAAERAGNAIHAVNPNWLIVVEGVEQHGGNWYWWGGNLMGVKDRPVQLATPNKVVYSPHDYPNSVFPQPWFSDASFPANLPAKFEQMWGYIYRQNIAPVLLGEFGTKLTDPKDQAWLQKITAYLDGDFDANGSIDIPAGKTGMSWAWWSWNPNSGDTGGILRDDWTTVNQDKLNALAPIFSAGGGTSNDGSGPDVINGAAGAQRLQGLGGDDTITDDPAGGPYAADMLEGGDGNDSLTSRGGADSLDGGAGTDTAVIERGGATAALTFTAPADAARAATLGGDGLTLRGIEAYRIQTGAGADRITAGALADSLRGGGGNDVLTGAGGADSLYGEAGADILDGGAGADRLDGGAGGDTATYGNAAAAVTVSLAAPAGNAGEAAGDSFVAIEHLRGSRWNDRLSGDGLANRLEGGGGADTLAGAAGSDTLVGGIGNDRLEGGAGVDVFVAATGMGLDTVADFAAGVDRLDLRGVGIASLAAAQAAATAQGADLRFDFGGGNVMLLLGVSEASLATRDFIFAT